MGVFLHLVAVFIGVCIGVFVHDIFTTMNRQIGVFHANYLRSGPSYVTQSRWFNSRCTKT